MIERVENQQPATSGIKTFFHNVTLMVTGGIGVAIALSLVGMWHKGGKFFDDLGAMVSLTQPAPKVDVSTIVISQVRGASDLTTAIFVMEAVVPTQQDWTLGSWTVGSSKLLYVAYGEVRAGVDLSKLQRQDVVVQGDSIVIHLPPPKILDRKIDVNRSRVYNYEKGVMGLAPDISHSLQTLAQQEAIGKISTAACNNGLLEMANEKAELTVTRLVSFSGYSKITIETQPPAKDACI
ncbi:DUF4230 domain-containing protein [Tumidithrix helvetica PCC 7403]|uniref:DUF4230 domain-containing protein n=1 Tax=Tumidithrix helvetica TaxID=3457545 RepID=UPI003CAE3EB0